MSVLDKFLDAIRLNDDYDDDDEFFDDEDMEEEEEKPKRHFSRKKTKIRSWTSWMIWTILLKNPEPPKRPKHRHRHQRGKTDQASEQDDNFQQGYAMRRKSGGNTMEVCVIKPTSMEDTRDIADTLIAHCTVVLNLEGIDVEVAQRIIDFSSGSCYSIGGGLQKISSYILSLHRIMWRFPEISRRS